MRKLLLLLFLGACTDMDYGVIRKKEYLIDKIGLCHYSYGDLDDLPGSWWGFEDSCHFYYVGDTLLGRRVNPGIQ